MRDGSRQPSTPAILVTPACASDVIMRDGCMPTSTTIGARMLHPSRATQCLGLMSLAILVSCSNSATQPSQPTGAESTDVESTDDVAQPRASARAAATTEVAETVAKLPVGFAVVELFTSEG